MGYLHEGHLSLIRRARTENDRVLVSVFVNPTQFGPNEDLDRYPRDPDADCAQCREAGADVVFMPEGRDMYPEGYQTYVEVGEIADPLCGAGRPGHFRGVATVCLKLFNTVKADRAYFGLKDYQQLRVIMTMVRDFNLDLEIVPCPIVREADGLAMSSRNAYLSPEERKQARCLSAALARAKRLIAEGETDAARYVHAMTDVISSESDAVIEYVSVVDPETLHDLREVRNGALAALAVRVGSTRLIDNALLRRPDSRPDDQSEN